MKKTYHADDEPEHNALEEAAEDIPACESPLSRVQHDVGADLDDSNMGDQDPPPSPCATHFLCKDHQLN